MKTTLYSLFVESKDELSEQLSGLTLPSGAHDVQEKVINYFNRIFDADGDFRQNLTQSEDYILQAALSMLTMQQSMMGELTPVYEQHPSLSLQSPKPLHFDSHRTLVGQLLPLGGSALGSTAGALLVGTWGAVFGAIAGTAVAMYFSTRMQQDTIEADCVSPSTPIEKELNVDAFIDIIGKICQSVDSLIDTFRAQINRVVSKYESQEKATLEKDFRFLLEGIQSLVGYKRTHSEDEPKYIRKLKERIEDVGELLENYNLAVVDYTEDNEYMFEVVEGQENRMVLPAIVKNGSVVLKGKIFKKNNVNQ